MSALDEVLAELQPRAKRTPPTTISIRCTAEWCQEVDAAAEELGVSRSDLIRAATSAVVREVRARS